MDWWQSLLLIVGSLLVLMALGFPTFLCFAIINLAGVFLFWGGWTGLAQLILSFRDSVSNFSFIPVPLFLLMGEAMFFFQIAPKMMDALDNWLGRVPGRLSLLAVGGGTVFGAVSGASMASVAMLGSVLLPEMTRRGYKKSISLGSILGASGLDVMIPPSALAVLAACIGRFSVGAILIAIIVPGLILAVSFTAYIMIRCWRQPSLAPSYPVPHVPISRKLLDTARYILPLGFVVFLVMGIIFLGVATPTEAAALGALSCFILAIAYRKFNWDLVKKSLGATIEVTIMLFCIITGAIAFSQTLAFTGSTTELIKIAAELPVAPVLVVMVMQGICLVLGCFIEQGSLLMITLPIFMPIVTGLGLDPVWFGTLIVLNMTIAGITPPFGLTNFVLKSIAPPDVTMMDIYKSVGPFVAIDIMVLLVILFVPATALWLPGLMR